MVQAWTSEVSVPRRGWGTSRSVGSMGNGHMGNGVASRRAAGDDGGYEVWLGLLADALGRLLRRPWKGAVLFERHLE